MVCRLIEPGPAVLVPAPENRSPGPKPPAALFATLHPHWTGSGEGPENTSTREMQPRLTDALTQLCVVNLMHVLRGTLLQADWCVL
jgi:hypothetical protein